MTDTVDLEPGDYWMTSSGDGKGRAIVTSQKRLLVEQHPDDDGTTVWSDMTYLYANASWKMQRRDPLVEIERWREFAGPDDYGHPPLEECDQPCEACMHDARVAVVVNRILDALAAEKARADRLAVRLERIQEAVCG